MPQANSTARHFYQGPKLNSVTIDNRSRCLFNAPFLSLAEQEHSEYRLKAVNAAGSVLRANAMHVSENHSYAPYGHDQQSPSSLTLLSFNAQQFHANLTCYLLGNGYRAYSPLTMRFHSPDNLSPFGKGGFNAYAYCAGDPINNTDPSGHFISNTVNYIARINLKDILDRKKSTPQFRLRSADRADLNTLKEFATADLKTTKSEIASKQNKISKLQTSKSTLENVINRNNSWIENTPIPSTGDSGRKNIIAHTIAKSNETAYARRNLTTIRAEIKTVNETLKDLNKDEERLTKYLNHANRLLRTL